MNEQLKLDSDELAAIELQASETLVRFMQRRVKEAEADLLKAYARLGRARKVAEEKGLIPE